MLSEKEMGLLYETLLSAPGMDDMVKLDLRIRRKNVLILTKIIESGSIIKSGDIVAGLAHATGEDNLNTFKELCSEMLAKAGLTFMNEKLQDLQKPPKEK